MDYAHGKSACDAMMVVLLSKKGASDGDEFAGPEHRNAGVPRPYDKMSYYERWKSTRFTQTRSSAGHLTHIRTGRESRKPSSMANADRAPTPDRPWRLRSACVTIYRWAMSARYLHPRKRGVIERF